jgi:hypothetical protein
MLWLFSPAIDIRPFVVRYMCPFSVRAFDCAVLIPVKLSSLDISVRTHYGIFLKHPPEHPDLVDDMVPVPWRLQFFCQQSVQLLAHVYDASGHRLDVPLPLLEEPIIIQNEGYLPTLFNV